MAFKQCSSCRGFYNTGKGGCTNPNCAACDRALVSRMQTTPNVPKVKPRRPPPVPAKKHGPPPVPAKKHGPPPTSSDKQPLQKPQVPTRKPRPLATIGSPPPETGPMPVASPTTEELQQCVQEQDEAGYYVVFRGDTRRPAQLATYGGFTAWVPLTVAQARLVVRRSFGENFDIELPKRAERLQAAFNRNLNLNLLTLGRQIKLEKAGDTFHISTDPTEDCGGYASGYIYAMRFKKLFLVDKAGRVTTGALKDVSGINPKLVLDKHRYADAELIAVAIPGGGSVEVAFLTSIPMANIYKYRMPGSKTWYKMP